MLLKIMVCIRILLLQYGIAFFTILSALFHVNIANISYILLAKDYYYISINWIITFLGSVFRVIFKDSFES